MNDAVDGPFTVLIVDDEPAARRGVAQLLEGDAELEVVGECTNGRDLVGAVADQRPDLVFLDVRMPGLDGFESLSTLRPEETPLVIFVTGYDRYAVRAFEAHAIDYILKPYSPERFRRACAHAKRQLRQRRLSESGGHPRRLLDMLAELARPTPSAAAADRDRVRFLVRKSQGRVVIVPDDTVLWIEAQGDYVALHTPDGVHLVRDTMGSVERQLDDRFVRVHRSTIVQVDGIDEIHLGGERLDVLLRDGSRHPVSARGRRKLRRRLGLKV